MERGDMQSLIDAFPTLRARRVVWDAEHGGKSAGELKKLMSVMGHGELCAAQFVLSVWNTQNKFNIHDAAGCWDHSHRAAVLEWLKDPWWKWMREKSVYHAGQRYGIRQAICCQGLYWQCAHHNTESDYGETLLTKDSDMVADWLHARNLPRKKVIALFPAAERRKIKWSKPKGASKK